MIDHLRRCIFVHIPKNAGNSIYSAFGTGWHNHKDLAGYEREMEPVAFESYYKFTIVRNPWERMLSEYNFQRKKSRPSASKLFLFNSNGKVRSFREWLDAVFNEP
ncbi:MAG TPA: sulfotransferase family 2 domain-containing protein, partial [Verrucomicrobiae bacterium]|nr:sulfotransferase family 2 domain-containing protein [Verrucomicrobiae bacterium]